MNRFVPIPRLCAFLGLFLIAIALPHLPPLFGDDSKEEEPTENLAPAAESERTPIYILPVQDQMQITATTFYIIRRGLKLAEENGVKHVIIDLDTPGGGLGSTLEIMKALSNFKGEVYTYINSEAISAGAFISIATDRIYFHPNGIIGAAEAVSGSGQDIPEGMQRKINSYIQAKVRSLTEEYRYRSDVMRAMSDPNFELEIDGTVLKSEGELLSLTAKEALTEYGDPPQALLGAGIYDTMDDLLTGLYGKDGYEVRSFEVTWSEGIAHYLNTVTPVLMGIGMLLLFIEFKTPGFGIFGIGGILLLSTVFASSHIAGLAGYEAILLFFLGIILVFLEIFLLPGLIFPAMIGIFLIVGSLVWSMADIWPDEPINMSIFTMPLLNFFIGAVIAVVGSLFIARFLPKTWVWNKLVLQTSLANATSMPPDAPHPGGGAGGDPSAARNTPHGWPDIGTTGTAQTDLFPNGEIEVGGKRYQAKSLLGQIERGSTVRVTDYQDFSLTVEEIQ